MITDEMVDKAVQVWLENASDYTRLNVSMRAALEAVAPMLIEQGRRIEIRALAEKIRRDANSRPPLDQ